MTIPSEDARFLLLEDGEALWLIVERLEDPSQQTHIQTIQDEDCSYIVAWRSGSEPTHQAARVPDMRAAHELLTR